MEPEVTDTGKIPVLDEPKEIENNSTEEPATDVECSKDISKSDECENSSEKVPVSPKNQSEIQIESNYSEKDNIEQNTETSEEKREKKSSEDCVKEPTEGQNNEKESEKKEKLPEDCVKESTEGQNNAEESEKKEKSPEDCVKEPNVGQSEEQENDKNVNMTNDDPSSVLSPETLKESEQKSPNDSDKENFSNVDNNKDVLSEKTAKVTEQDGSECLEESNNLNDSTSSKGVDNVETDDDFDPSLLCPEVYMNVNENEVINSYGENVPVPVSASSPIFFETLYSTLVDEITGAEVMFDLTPEEEEIRKQTFGPNKPIKFSSVHCSACHLHLGTALAAQKNRFVHPLLKVLVCKDCYHFYTSGEFEKDEDGSELYCRWCGQGGQVICCSKCEFVFCKKCIRRNFGPKKVKDITDSDDWECFRCNPRQLCHLRAACAELFEYVRTELSRTSENDIEALSKDYSPCCQNASKRNSLDGSEAVPKKRKRRSSSTDPDYVPTLDDINESIKVNQKQNVMLAAKPAVPLKLITSIASSAPTTATTPAPAQFIYIPQTTNPVQFQPIPGQMTQIRILRPPKPAGTQPIMIRSLPSTSNIVHRIPLTAATRLVSPNVNQTQTIRIAPPPLTPRPTLRPPVQRTTVQRVRIANPRTVTPQQHNDMDSKLKHEWFEKTVRSAARVNSNLSYTLTQLNRFQANATSVKDLAIVHNKLQEVLSNSINGLIQIRKNLHTDFVSGVKAIKMKPVKVVEKSRVASDDDDDVIFVDTSNSVASNVIRTETSTVKKSTAVEPTSYLKVRPISALQNIPKECITIPDEPSLPVSIRMEPPPLKVIAEKEKVVKESILLNTLLEGEKVGVSSKVAEKEDGECIKQEEVILEDETKPSKESFVISNVESVADQETTVKPEVKPIEVKKKENVLKYNVKKFPSPMVKRMMSAKVRLERNEEMESRIRKQFSLGKRKRL